MEIWKVCFNAQTKVSKYFMQLMSAGDIFHQDLEHKKQSVFSRTIINVNISHGIKLRILCSYKAYSDRSLYVLRKVAVIPCRQRSGVCR